MEAADKLRECRICGCTEGNACHDDRTQTNCHWVAPDLCSACVAQDRMLERLTATKGLALGDAFTEWEELNGSPAGPELEAFATFFFMRGFDSALAFVEALELVLGQDSTRCPAPATYAPRIILRGDDLFSASERDPG